MTMQVPVSIVDRQKEERRDIVSMMLMCNVDVRRPGLSNTPVVMEHDNNRTKQ
jgi:hypothetical protein